MRTPGGPSNPPSKLNQMASGAASATVTIKTVRQVPLEPFNRRCTSKPNQKAAQEEHDEPKEDNRCSEQDRDWVPIPPRRVVRTEEFRGLSSLTRDLAAALRTSQEIRIKK